MEDKRENFEVNQEVKREETVLKRKFAMKRRLEVKQRKVVIGREF